MFKQEEIPVYPKSDDEVARELKVHALNAAAIVYTGRYRSPTSSILDVAREFEKYLKENR